MESDDEVVLLLGEFAALHGRAQVVQPPQSAALPMSLEAYAGRKRERERERKTCEIGHAMQNRSVSE